MRYFLLLFAVLSTTALHAQSTDENTILRLSKTMFRWEVENKVDSLDKLWDDKFVVVDGTGAVQTKAQYLATLRSGNFVHNGIVVEENKARVSNGTGTIVGKGRFTVTISRKQVSLRLSYIEVYTRNKTGQWQVIALHATVLGD